MSQWKNLGNPAPKDLVEARLELHYAAQLLGIAIGRSLLVQQDDDSNTAMTWEDGCWWSGCIPGKENLRAFLYPTLLTLGLGEQRISLVGKTLQDGLDWLRQQLDAHGVDGSKASLDAHYDMPDHPVAHGAAFDAKHEAGFEQLGMWFDGANALLHEVEGGYPNASVVLTWPHHFDMGLVIPLGPDDQDRKRVIGVGMSPGDGYYAEPYFYVTPWPAPKEDPPPPPIGFWKHKDFFGAILTGTDLLAGGKRRMPHAKDFLHATINAGFDLLGVKRP